MPDINNMSLKTIAFQPATFQAVGYTPLQQDIALTERTLANIENRQQKAVEAQGAVDDALAKIEATLYNKSEEQNQWWSDYKANIKQQIQNQINAGEYGEAIRLGTNLAHSVFTDSSVLGRMQASQEYMNLVDEQRKRVGAKENGITQETFDWWLENNKYNYNKAYDSQGREVRGSLDDISAPVSSLNVAGLFLMATQLYEEEKYSTTKDKFGGTTNPDGTGNQWKNNSSNAYSKKEEEKIRENLRELLANEDIQNQLYQQFWVDKHNLEKLQKQYNEAIANGNPEAANILQQLESAKQYLYRNGQPITDYNQWLKLTIDDNPFGKNLSYDRIVESTNSGKITDNRPVGATDPSNNPNVPGNSGSVGMDEATGQGSPVEMYHFEVFNELKVNKSTSTILNILDKTKNNVRVPYRRQ